MIRAAVSVACAAAAGAALATQYRPERALRVASAIELSMQITAMEVEIDGEPRPGPDGDLPASESTWTVAQVDRVVEAADGAPAVVRRRFESAASARAMAFGGEENTDEAESPFEGVELELRAGKDGVEVEVVDGSAPEHEGALEGHRLELALDALLPEGEVEAGATWELDAERVRRALGFDLMAALFPPPEREPGAGGPGGGGGRRMGPMLGQMGSELLARAEWKGKAELAALDEEIDGTKCARIALELRAEGELPDPPMGRGPRGGGGGDVLGLEPARSAATTYEIALEGELIFDLGARRPTDLKLSGRVETESNREFSRGERQMRFHTPSEGELTLHVSVVDEPAAGD
jgi:hypothetical protein